MKTEKRHILRQPRALLAGALAALGMLSASGGANAGEPVVVELFTSQGCAFCPKADALLTSVAGARDVIALSWAVDYWDYLGWEDTLALPLSTARQRWYNQALYGRESVYTPQVFIDGVEAFVGGHKSEIEAAIAEHQGDAQTMVDIMMDASKPGVVNLSFSAALPDNARISAVFFDAEHIVTVKGGENEGYEGTYTNIVRGVDDLTPANIDADMKLSVDMSSRFAKNCDAFAILVQDRQTGKMLGAAVHRMNKNRS